MTNRRTVPLMGTGWDLVRFFFRLVFALDIWFWVVLCSLTFAPALTPASLFIVPVAIVVSTLVLGVVAVELSHLSPLDDFRSNPFLVRLDGAIVAAVEKCCGKCRQCAAIAATRRFLLVAAVIAALIVHALQRRVVSMLQQRKKP